MCHVGVGHLGRKRSKLRVFRESGRGAISCGPAHGCRQSCLQNYCKISIVVVNHARGRNALFLSAAARSPDTPFRELRWQLRGESLWGCRRRLGRSASPLSSSNASTGPEPISQLPARRPKIKLKCTYAILRWVIFDSGDWPPAAQNSAGRDFSWLPNLFGALGFGLLPNCIHVFLASSRPRW